MQLNNLETGVILAPLAATVQQLALSKLDAGSQRIPLPAARPEMAGMYIVDPLAGRRVSLGRWFSDHPPTGERIARLRAATWVR